MLGPAVAVLAALLYARLLRPAVAAALPAGHEVSEVVHKIAPRHSVKYLMILFMSVAR